LDDNNWVSAFIFTTCEDEDNEGDNNRREYSFPIHGRFEERKGVELAFSTKDSTSFSHMQDQLDLQLNGALQ
jgi:hypothetical protein